MHIAATLLPLFRATHTAKGRALLVGGCVRDALLGLPSKDQDIEVHGLEIAELLKVLRRFGHVNEVGKSFGVLKLRLDGKELDISVPRVDARQGPGHKGIQATAAPHIGTMEAARRRDLTINAIAYDPLAEEFVDPFHGRQDLFAHRLRAVDPTTFGEDPLRALRVAQFAARLVFEVDPGLEGLCREMPLAELPAERIHGEIDKLLLKAVCCSVGWNLAYTTGMWAKVIPVWRECPENLDRLVQTSRQLEVNRRRALLMAAACGNNTVEEATEVLDRLRLHRWEGYRLRQQVLFLVQHRDSKEPSDAALRRMADAGDLELLSLLQENPKLAQQASRLGVLYGPLPPILLGRDLEQLGMLPGPEMGKILAIVRSEQLDGRLLSSLDAIVRARELIPQTG